MLFHFSFVGQEYEQLGDSSVPCGINRAYLVVPAEGAWSGGSLPYLVPGQRHWMAGFIWNSHTDLASRTCLTWTTHLEPVHLTWTTHLGPLQHGGLGVARQLIWWLRTPRASVPFKHLSWKCQGPPWANLWGPRSHFCLIWLGRTSHWDQTRCEEETSMSPLVLGYFSKNFWPFLIYYGAQLLSHVSLQPSRL